MNLEILKFDVENELLTKYNSIVERAGEGNKEKITQLDTAVKQIVSELRAATSVDEIRSIVAKSGLKMPLEDMISRSNTRVSLDTKQKIVAQILIEYGEKLKKQDLNDRDKVVGYVLDMKNFVEKIVSCTQFEEIETELNFNPLLNASKILNAAEDDEIEIGG